MQTRLIIGTRGSKLSLIQSEFIVSALKLAMPGIETELKIISVKGDRDKQTPLTQDAGAKDWFTAEIEAALVSGEIDLAMHSLKDVPPIIERGTIIMPVLERADPRDVLLSKNNLKLNDLPQGAKVGTDSIRRKAQLLAIRNDLQIVSLRGNVETRVGKLQNDEYDAIVLAAAGLSRLGLLDTVSEFFDPETFVPAPGQGVIAAQVRENDIETIELVKKIQHEQTRAAAEAEVAFSKALGGGCTLPAGCYARVSGDSIILNAMLSEIDGTNTKRENIRVHINEAVNAAEALAKKLLG